MSEKNNKMLNTKRNVIFGMLNKIVLMIFPFIVRTVIIWKLGIEYLGLSSLFGSILQVLSLAELGFGNAIVYSMYKPIAENDISLINSLLNHFRKIYMVVGSIIVVAGLALLPFLDKLIAGSHPNDVNIYILYLIMLFNTGVSYFLFAYKQSLLLAHQRTDVDNNMSTVVFSLMYVAQIAMLLLTSNYYFYIIMMPVFTVMLNLVRNYYISKLYPEFKCEGIIDEELKKDISKRVVGIALTKICQVCRNSFDSIVISAFLGLVILGIYQNYYYIISALVGILSIFTSSVLAAIGNNVVTKDKDYNYSQFKSIVFIYNWIASICTVCLLCLYQPFMELWVGKENTFGILIVILLCFYFYIQKIGDVLLLYKDATGIYWEDRFRPIIESVANLVLNIVLVRFFGVSGVIVATIVTMTFIYLPWSINVLFKHYFERSAKEYILKVIINFIITAVIMCTVYYVCIHIILSSLVLTLIFRAIVCILLGDILLYIINIKNPELGKSVSIVKQMIKSKSKS